MDINQRNSSRPPRGGKAVVSFHDSTPGRRPSMLHCFDCDVAVVARRLHNEQFQQEEKEPRRDERWRVCACSVRRRIDVEPTFLPRVRRDTATQPGQKMRRRESETETGNLSPKVSAGSPLVGKSESSGNTMQLPPCSQFARNQIAIPRAWQSRSELRQSC